MPPTKVCPQCETSVPVRKAEDRDSVDAVIMSFDPANKKQSVICERKLWNA